MTAPTQYEIELLARAKARVAKSRVCYVVEGNEKVAYPYDCKLIIDLIGQIESLRTALDMVRSVNAPSEE